MKRPSVGVPDGLHKLVSELSDESAARDDVPKSSKAEIYRELFTLGALALAEDRDDLPSAESLLEEIDATTHTDYALGVLGRDDVDVETILPEHVLVRLRRERIKDENWLADIRGGFRGRVKDELVERWQNGYIGDDLEAVSAGFIAEAHAIYSDVERREEAIAYVENAVETLREASEESEHDALSVEDAVDRHSGVEDGREQSALERARDDGTLADMVSEASTALARAGTAFDTDALIDRLSKQFGVLRGVSEEAVSIAQQNTRDFDTDHE